MVLGFLLLQDDDLLMRAVIDPVGVLSSGRLRRRTPLGDMPGDCWIGWYSVVHIHIFSDRLGSEGAWRSSVVCCHHGTRLTVDDEVRCGE
jgi:hypothetical protein